MLISHDMAGLSFEPQSGVSNKEANAAFKKGLNKVYGWYTTFNGQTPTTVRAGPYSVSVSSAGQILSQNLTWQGRTNAGLR